ncbi:MAG: transcription termination/antitermination protein NusG [Candidatus Solibacter usitatus]|nr:transcription termination/antitermination protein NusG [Candidatus Solibacter usitatus]
MSEQEFDHLNQNSGEPEASAAPEPASEAAPEPASEAAPEPASEAAPEPASEAVPEPASEAAPEPASEAAPEPASEAAPEPASEAVPEPASEAVPEPASVEPVSLAPEVESPVEAAGSATAEPAPPEEAAVLGMDWFIIHTYSGFENKVAESLRARSTAYGFADRLGQVLIPTEEVVELRNGKKVTSKRLLYPGYVMVQMAMDDELWHHVKNTPRVTGFVGGGNTPVPLTADEVNNVLFRQASAAEHPRPRMSFEKNETVRIVDGPFTNFQGKVDEVNVERNTLRVLVTIFGRATPVELEFLQVEKSN